MIYVQNGHAAVVLVIRKQMQLTGVTPNLTPFFRIF